MVHISLTEDKRRRSPLLAAYCSKAWALKEVRLAHCLFLWDTGQGVLSAKIIQNTSKGSSPSSRNWPRYGRDWQPMAASAWDNFKKSFTSSKTGYLGGPKAEGWAYRPHPTLRMVARVTINVPLFKKLRDIIFFCGTITLWAISRDILRGPRLFWPQKNCIPKFLKQWYIGNFMYPSAVVVCCCV